MRNFYSDMLGMQIVGGSGATLPSILELHFKRPVRPAATFFHSRPAKGMRDFREWCLCNHNLDFAVNSSSFSP
jgi:hypothetical protein